MRVQQQRRNIPWLPVHDRGALEEFGVQGKPIRFLIGLALLFSIFAFEPVAKTTRVSLANIAPLWGGLRCGTWSVIGCSTEPR